MSNYMIVCPCPMCRHPEGCTIRQKHECEAYKQWYYQDDIWRAEDDEKDSGEDSDFL